MIFNRRFFSLSTPLLIVIVLVCNGLFFLKPLAVRANPTQVIPGLGINNVPVARDDATRMFAVSPFQARLFDVSPLTYMLISDSAFVTLPGFTVTGVNSIAIQPSTGTYFVILKVIGVSGRVLATFDPETGVTAQIGNLGDNFSNLAFTPDGTLYGVTGDGASVPETLYTIDPTTAAKTLFMSLGNGADGETIAYNPDDGFMYHSSGNGTPIFEKIDLATQTVTNVSPNLGTGEIFHMRYIGNNTFLTVDIGSSVNLITTAGVVTDITGGLADDYRGFAYDGFTPYAGIEDSPLIVTSSDNHLLINDFDGDADPLTAVLDTTSPGVTVNLNPDGTFTYNPAPNFCGTDTFTYHVNDGLSDSNQATATLTISCLNDPLIAIDDLYTVTEDIPYTASAPGVLTNDSDPDGSVFTPTLLTAPGSGTLDFNLDGSFTYTPTLNFNGTVSFTYQISNTFAAPALGYWPFDDGTNPTSDQSGNGYDGTLVNGATFTTTIPVTLSVTLTNGLAIDFDGIDDSVNTAGTIDLAGQSFTVAFWARRDSIGALDIAVGHGTLATNNQAMHIGFRNTNLFTCGFWANDLNTSTAYTDNNWHHWACTYDAFTNARTIYRDGVAVASDVASADYQGIGPLSIGTQLGGSPFDGLLDDVRLYAVSLSPGEIVEIMTQTSTFETASATVTLNITPVNDAPIAVSDIYTTTEDSDFFVFPPGVLGNDSDPVEGDPLTAVLDTDVTTGTLTLMWNDGSFNYVPPSDWFGTATFTYHAYDGQDASNVVTVTLNVTSENDAPVAVDDSYALIGAPSLIVSPPGVLGNDSDIDGDTLMASLDTPPGQGTVTINVDGSFVYTPTIGFQGVDTFKYTLSDGTDLASGMVTITVLDAFCFVEANGDNVTDYYSNDESAVQTAAKAATPGDTLKVAGTCAGVHTTQSMTQTVILTQSLNLQGGYTITNWLATPDPTTYPTVLSAQENGRVVVVMANVTATLSGFTIMDGNFESGAGILVAGNATVTVTDSMITGNNASHGSGIYSSGVLTVDNTTFEDNHATVNGTITNYNTLTVRNTTFSGNTALRGGGIYSEEFTTLTINNSTFANNTANEGGGIHNRGTMTLTFSTFSGNTADFGSALHNWNGTMTLANNIMAGNTGSSAQCRDEGTLVASINNLITDGSCSATLTIDPLLSPLGNYGGDTETFNLLAYSPAIDFIPNGTAGCGTTTVTDQRGFVRPFEDGCDIGAVELETNFTPIAASDSYTTTEDTPLVISASGVLTNDVDGDWDTLTAILDTNVTTGTLTLNGDGSFTYTPPADWLGTTTFTYHVFDGQANSVTVVVTITVVAPEANKVYLPIIVR